MAKKTKNLSYEANGISLAVKLEGVKAFYLTPSQLTAVVQNGPSLVAQMNEFTSEDLSAIEQRASMDPESRKANRIASGLAAAEKAVADAKDDASRKVAQLKLDLFKASNGLT